MNLLKQISQDTKKRVEQAKREISFEEMKTLALTMPKGAFAFEKALRKPGISMICECKKASPSKGLIAEDFPYMDIAKCYENAGADAISVLTEPKWFLGRNEYLKEIAEKTAVPCLRKDFTIDEYMIYEAKVLGASAVLLICSLLTEEEIEKDLEICEQLGLSALTEVHNEQEIQIALRAGSRLIGVNNRCLEDFTVDQDRSRWLRNLVPKDILFVAESGVKTRKEVEAMEKIGADGVLIGEALMRASDKKAKLRELRGCI